MKRTFQVPLGRKAAAGPALRTYKTSAMAITPNIANTPVPAPPCFSRSSFSIPQFYPPAHENARVTAWAGLGRVLKEGTSYSRSGLELSRVPHTRAAAEA